MMGPVASQPRAKDYNLVLAQRKPQRIQNVQRRYSTNRLRLGQPHFDPRRCCTVTVADDTNDLGVRERLSCVHERVTSTGQERVRYDTAEA